MKKNKKILILSSLIIVMVVALTFVVSRIGAWLTDTDETPNVTLSVGEVKYEAFNTSFINGDDGPFVPGQNLVDGNTLHLKNQSNVLSELRFSYTITYTLAGQSTTVDALAENLFSTITWATGWAAGTGGESDPTGYFYLSVGGNQEIAPSYNTAIRVIEELVLNGHIVGNDFANAEFTIKFVFQAKQADHLNWSSAGSLDFTTGLAPTNP